MKKQLAQFLFVIFFFTLLGIFFFTLLGVYDNSIAVKEPQKIYVRVTNPDTGMYDDFFATNVIIYTESGKHEFYIKPK